MAPDGRRRSGEALGHLAELEPNLVAGEEPGLGSLGKRDSRAHQKRLDARDRGLHGLRDLVVGERVDLAQEKGGPLGLRQLLDVGHDLAELLALVDRVGGAGSAVALEHVHRVLARRGWTAQVVEAAVARDPVEPRPGVDRAIVRQHRVVGRREHLLEHVLGVLGGAEHVPAEGHEPRLVAVHQRLEGRRVAAAGERDQPLVGLQPEEGRAPRQRGQAGRVLESGGFQGEGRPCPTAQTA